MFFVFGGLGGGGVFWAGFVLGSFFCFFDRRERRAVYSTRSFSSPSASRACTASPGPTFAHDPKGAESRIYRRARGVTWEPVADGLPPAIGMTAPALAADPVEPGVFYAASNLGVYRSTNGGHKWEPLAIPWAEEDFGRRIRSLLVVP